MLILRSQGLQIFMQQQDKLLTGINNSYYQLFVMIGLLTGYQKLRQLKFRRFVNREIIINHKP